MMLELHNVTIGEKIRSLSLAVKDGQLLSVEGAQGVGKTTLLRALLGLIPIDGGHISIDGELLTPLSAPYFRRQTAYVPQRLTVPEGCDMPTDYMTLLRKAATSGKQLIIVDEPSQPLSGNDAGEVARLLKEATEQGALVVAVNSSQNSQYSVQL